MVTRTPRPAPLTGSSVVRTLCENLQQTNENKVGKESFSHKDIRDHRRAGQEKEGPAKTP